MAEEQAPIIVIKKKHAHAGHHGGAWKVAYADFVTAMMALFIVLWLLSSSAEVQKAVGGYFNDPSGSGKLMGSSMAGSGAEGIAVSKDNMDKLKEKLEQALKEVPKFEEMKEQVKLTVTGEGLRVELMETANGMFFEQGNANPSENGKQLLVSLAENMGKLPNHIVIEGHTDAKPYAPGAIYTNWELSTDRANAARRAMEGNGLREGQVKELRGFADQDLRKPSEPEHASNRRISVIVKYINGAKADPKPPAPDKPKPSH